MCVLQVKLFITAAVHTCATSTCCLRYQGDISAESLQHFAADSLLELPQLAAVTPESLDSFLAQVPLHKTSLVTFSKAPGAAIALRQAVHENKMLITAGRVHWGRQAGTHCLSIAANKAAVQAWVEENDRSGV